MALYEELYGRRCRKPLSWIQVAERRIMGLKLVDDAIEKIRLIRDRLKVIQDR